MPRIPPELAASRRPRDRDPITQLSQVSGIAEIDELGCGEWTVLYEYHNNSEVNRCSYSGLLTNAQVVDVLKHDNWDLRIGLGGPSFSQRRRGGVDTVEYDRFGFDGVEPAVYLRDFHGIKPPQFDLSEEFRLFHNLYHDRQNDRYVHVDDRGNETIVADVVPDRCRVLTRFLRQYMAARQLALVLYFDHRVDAEVDVDAAKAAFPSQKVVTPDRNYSFHIGEMMGRSFSRLVGKKIIRPPPIAKSGVWPYEAERHDRYAEFIIGVGEDGLPVYYGCNPDDLANYFGANENSPHYLTPVWFRRDVLVKYYNDPSKFSVEDGYLRCGSLWGLQMDNNQVDHVVVYLGDLGRDLDYEEQIYWKHFNLTPGDRQPSETNFQRAFLAQFADPSAPDLRFKQAYTQLNEAWTKKFGWSIFRPLHEADAHILRQFHIPITESLGEFDVQLLYLVKLLIDSLNEGELTRASPGGQPAEKGISKFKRYLEYQQYPHTDRDISILRTLQDLRSSGAAHAKGKNFDKIGKRVGLGIESPKDVFRGLMSKVNQMLIDLVAHFFPASE
jgi:hypothetical protein